MVRARVGEVVVEVVPPQVAPVRADARVRVGPPVQHFVGHVHADEADREGRPRGPLRRRTQEREGEPADGDRGERLLPRRREVVALAVVAGVLDGEEVRHGAPVVPEEAMQHVLEDRPRRDAERESEDESEGQRHAATSTSA